MRLDEIQQILHANVGRLRVTHTAAGDQQNFKVSGILEAAVGVREVQKTGIFQKECQAVLDVEALSLAVQDPVVVSTGIFKQYGSPLDTLRQRVAIVDAALNEYLEELKPESILVRLPEMTNVEAAGKMLIEIDKMLSQFVVNEYLDGKVQLVRFAVGGTPWIDIYLASALAYRFIAAMIDLYFGIKQRQNHQKAQEELLKGLTLETAHRQAVFDAINAEVKAFSEKRLKEIFDEHDIPADDHEFARRTENSLRMLGSLLDRGVEIHPTLTATSEWRSLLPDPKRILDTIKSLPLPRGEEDDKESTEG